MGQLIQAQQALSQSQRSLHSQIKAQLHHGKGDFRLDPHDHEAGAAQAKYMGHCPQRPAREGVHYIQHRDVDNDSTRP